MLVHLKTLGCRLNEAELETWARDFQKSGHQITRRAEAAQVIVLNSCAVTQDAVRKSRQLVRRIHKENPSAKLVVTGCYASLNPEQAAAALEVDLVVANQDKHLLVEKTLARLNLAAMPAFASEPGEQALFSLGRQRAFVKVQDGCRYRCTFCIVTVARGEEQSRPLAQIIDEINALQQQGVHEMVLTGVHLGGYGSDLGCDLARLIQAILEQTKVPRIRLGSLEPWELTDEFFALFQNPRLLPHLHLPLQSGSDSVLKRMARRCRTAEFTGIVERLRAITPNFNITTDIMVGFPGETEREWQASVDFVKAIGFGHIHIFTYSKREGTQAASFPDQIPEPVKKQRAQELQALAAGLKQQFWQRNIGEEFQVLWEAYSEPYDEGRQLTFGYAPNYVRVGCLVDKQVSLVNQILNVRLTAVNGDFVLAELQ